MNTQALGQLVSDRRKRLGLDQRALAELAGVSVHALSNIESGSGNPTFKVIQAVSESLGLEVTLQLKEL